MRRIALLCAALLLAGCSAGTPADSKTADSVQGFPVELTNCGEHVTVTKPPQRIVSLNQGSTEILLSLGLADRIVGTATWTDPILPSLAEANARVPRISDNAPSLEAVLDKNPDFVTASFTSTLGAGGVATRAQFEKLGVGTYIAPSDCEGKEATSGDGKRDTPFDINLVYREIRDFARIFDVQKAGEDLVASLQKKLAEAGKVDASGTTALFWFANSESPYMAGCCGAPGLISHTLKLKNVFDDTTDEWPQINWETVAERNPDVLVIGDLTRKSQTAETGKAKIAFLETNPVTRQMDAVKNKRYILISGAEMNPSLRTIYGVQTVATGLRKLGLAH